MYYTYILQSEKTNAYYIRCCENISIRIHRHNAGATPSTKNGRPWKVVYFEEYSMKSEALLREKYIKSMKSRNYIQKLIDSSVG